MKRRRPSRKSPTSTTTSSRKAKSRARRTTRKRSSDSSPERERIAYLSLGSNRGGRRARIEKALARISRRAPVQAVSSYYRTEPVGYGDQPEFLNVAAAVRWAGSPRGLLRLTQSVEKAVGRRPSFPDGPREIDVDVLDLGGLVR
ncbi:MAG TPA: 2-amino-4-hydroxy-6-hydroxymethyldihydropteridine diphosphokinase, partial [Thermoanaerobaculia bacterium]|nr:2-amino-4-hydroxy-6-hydroxymethyldihydropteridine diphosphokinase [Thermoanaerobaculia bacterium]